MVDESSHFSGLHKMHAIQVGHVNSPLVRQRVVLAMLINVECKKYHIHPINVLEHHDAFATVREFVGISLMSVSGFHEITYFMLSVRGCNLADGKRAAYREGFVCFFIRNILLG